MKIQEIDTIRGRRWILLDDEYRQVESVNGFLKFLDYTKREENTLRAYAGHLKLFCEFLHLRNVDIMGLSEPNGAGPLNILSDFLTWLQHSDTVRSENIMFFDTVSKQRKDVTLNAILSTVLLFYDYLARNEMATPLDVYRTKVSPQRFKPFLFGLLRRREIRTQSLFHISAVKPELKYITPDLYKCILSKCQTWRDKSIIAVMYEGGLRLGEALGLRISDIEIWNSKIRIIARPNHENHCHVKNRAEGVVYVSTDTMEYISQYFAYERAEYDHDFVFLNLRGPGRGNPLKPDTIEKLFQRISTSLGVHVHPHMCRHGCATARLEAGWDEASIQKLLRHASLSSTRIYEHFRDEMLLEKSKDFILKQQNRFGWKELNENDKSVL